jgi:hypothetical protein
MEWSASRSGRALTPGKEPPVPTVQEAGWAPKPVWTQEARVKILCLCWGSNLDRVVQSIARYYTDWATPAPIMLRIHSYKNYWCWMECEMYNVCWELMDTIKWCINAATGWSLKCYMATLTWLYLRTSSPQLQHVEAVSQDPTDSTHATSAWIICVERK